MWRAEHSIWLIHLCSMICYHHHYSNGFDFHSASSPDPSHNLRHPRGTSTSTHLRWGCPPRPDRVRSQTRQKHGGTHMPPHTQGPGGKGGLPGRDGICPGTWSRGKPGAPGCMTPASHTSDPFPPAEQDDSLGFVVGWGGVTG